MFNLDVVSDDVEYAVFDDLIGGFEFFRNYKGWLGAQEEFTLSDKWRHKKRMLWGKPSILLMNDDPMTSPHIDYDWVMGNCFVIHAPDPFIILDEEWPASPQGSTQ